MDIQMTDIQLFQILRERLGEKEAQALVTFVDAKIKETNRENLKVLATKEDIVRLEGMFATSLEQMKSEVLKWVFMTVGGAVVINTIAILGAFFMLANILRR